MRLPHEQLTLFERRLQAIGVSRRDFLKVVGAMAALAGTGFVSRVQAAKPTKPAPGEKLARDQVIRIGGGGYFQNDPSSHDFNKDLYSGGHPALFAGLMRFTADFVAVPWLAAKVESNRDGSVWT
ncbi:MAG: twin-arginine translocation signal domain-containing protein, partial [Candidatus Rokubacteria bacterium]|nr:twin-arginine translocation signal domain-containing protein [Candidatus Rokubacteria bacterium]